MTGYTVHTGSNLKFTEGWDRVFQTGGGTKPPTTLSDPAKKKAAVSKKVSKTKASVAKTAAKKSKRSR